MATLPTEKDFSCLDEAAKGCVSIRLYACVTVSGAITYLLALIAWNSWAGQGKLVEAIGGLDRDTARHLFEAARENIRTFSWTDNDFVYEERI